MMWKWNVFAVVAALVVGWWLFAPPSPENIAKEHKRRISEVCWQDYERKSHAPDTKLLLAAECERLDGLFKAQYGRMP